jgi:phage shock protein A
MKKDLQTGIKRCQSLEEKACARAKDAIAQGAYAVALIAIAEAMGHSETAKELEFQLECLEVE